MANYYCLMAGAPDLNMSDTAQRITFAEMREQVDNVLTPEDAKLMFYFYLYWDCRNIVRLLENPDAELDMRGNFTREQYVDLLTSARELTFNVHRYPSFLSIFAREYPYNVEKPGYFAEDDMMYQYYLYGMQCPNKMMRRWFHLNLNINNILTAMIARQNGWNVADYVQGEDEVAEQLRENNTKDFDLSTDLDYMKDLMAVVEEQDPVQKERRIDAFRWTWLDERTFFEPFAFETVFAYMCKLQMLDRWSRLDPEIGKQTFERIIDDLRGEAKVPEEFKPAAMTASVKSEGNYNKSER